MIGFTGDLWFAVEDADRAVSDLQDINVTGERRVSDVVGCEEDWHLDRDGCHGLEDEVAAR